MTGPARDIITAEEWTAGYTADGDRLVCLFCDHAVTRGHVYRLGQDLVEAGLAMRRHLEQAHGSVVTALLALGKKGTGLSDTQRAVLAHMHAGRSDREMQPLLGGVSLSTIRNHRFALREKARQARAFVALMTLLERDDRPREPQSEFIEIPGRKAADDERFAITRAEYDRIIRTLFPEGPDGPLASFPSKEKRKVAVLVHLRRRFDPARRYTQKEVDAILATASGDTSTLRRFMVDYGFLGRTRDGAEYWVE
ncbi:DUF2087 domain-containing protein [bacterium]|nr:DUF2087 domain-containing protein [bacterium]